MFAVFIDAYHAKLMHEKGKVTDVSIFVAVGIRKAIRQSNLMRVKFEVDELEGALRNF